VFNRVLWSNTEEGAREKQKQEKPKKTIYIILLKITITLSCTIDSLPTGAVSTLSVIKINLLVL
jgi:hypothetical protein